MCVLFCFTIVFPDDVTCIVLDFHFSTVPRTFCSLDKFADVSGTTINLAAHTMQVDAVFHCEIDAEVIILVARDTALARTETDSFNRFQAAEPCEYIDVVHMLFHDMVSG